MKNRFLILIFSLLIVCSFALAGCNSDTKEKDNSSNKTQESTTEQIKAQATVKGVTIEGKNETGRCYDLDLDTFTENFNKSYKEKTGKSGPVYNDKGDNQPLDRENWTVIGDKNQKDGKTSYTAYSQSTGKSQMVVSVDDNSGKIITFTTATTNLLWQNSAEEVKETAVIGTIVLGKYSTDDYEFFSDLYDTAISGNCYYDNVIYKVDGSNYDKNNQDEMVIKLIAVPANQEAIKDTQYTDYKLYRQGKCGFGQH